MGAGKGRARRAQRILPTSVGRIRRELLKEFDDLGYQTLYRPVVATQTMLYRYCPNMRATRTGEMIIAVELYLDRDSDELSVVGSVGRYSETPFTTGPVVSVYVSASYGSDLQQSLRAAQALYDKTHARFKESTRGRDDAYITPLPTEWTVPPGRMEKYEYENNVFGNAEKDIAAVVGAIRGAEPADVEELEAILL
jgi:hypothetical protein